MRVRTAAPSVAAGLSLLAVCAAATAGSPDVPACAGFVAPTVLAFVQLPLPSTYTAARVGADVTDEVVIGRDGTVQEVRFVRSDFPFLGPFAEESLKRSTLAPASIEGNPVSTRVESVTQVGSPPKARANLPYDSLRAFVPGGPSREARWQLAGSVDRLTLVVHVGKVSGQNVSIVAVSPSGSEKTLLALAPAAAPQDPRTTVRTGTLLAPAGNYRLELRAGRKTLASTTVTIAAGFESAIVNACEPIRIH